MGAGLKRKGRGDELARVGYQSEVSAVVQTERHQALFRQGRCDKFSQFWPASPSETVFVMRMVDGNEMAVGVFVKEDDPRAKQATQRMEDGQLIHLFKHPIPRFAIKHKPNPEGPMS